MDANKKMNVDMATRCLKAISHPVRLQIIMALGEDKKCVNDLIAETKVSQSSVSQHLGMMKDRGLLQCERVGSQVFYFLTNKDLLKLVKILTELYCPLNN